MSLSFFHCRITFAYLSENEAKNVQNGGVGRRVPGGGYLAVSCSDICKASVCKTVVGPDAERVLGPPASLTEGYTLTQGTSGCCVPALPATVPY